MVILDNHSFRENYDSSQAISIPFSFDSRPAERFQAFPEILIFRENFNQANGEAFSQTSGPRGRGISS